VIFLASGTSAASMTSTASTTSVTSTASFHKKKLTELDISISPDTKMTYPSLLMWDESSKIHFFIDFWHPFSWRLWSVEDRDVTFNQIKGS
jgi:hypothetical protein